MPLRSHIAMAVAVSSGCRSDSTPHLGTSTCPGCGSKKTKKKKESRKEERRPCKLVVFFFFSTAGSVWIPRSVCYNSITLTHGIFPKEINIYHYKVFFPGKVEPGSRVSSVIFYLQRSTRIEE